MLQQPIVVKVGSSLIAEGGVGIANSRLSEWVGQIAQLRQSGHLVVLVSSGAIAVGMEVLGWTVRPKKICDLQAAAAVGQVGLIKAYQKLFDRFHILAAQVLLTHDDIKERCRYLNVRTTLLTLLKQSVLPIINENDTVSTAEINLGNNDTLGAMVASLLNAKAYIILTDCAGVYDDDPRSNPQARLIDEAAVNDPRLLQVARGSGSKVGTGGMYTKIRAARKAAKSGVKTIIASGQEEDVLLKIMQEEKVGTCLKPTVSIVNARSQWLINQLIVAGVVIIDPGAAIALREYEKSLLPIGCVCIQGRFKRGDVVSICLSDNKEIARGLINYSSEDALRIMGLSTDKIEQSLGYIFEEELVHRNHMVLMEIP